MINRDFFVKSFDVVWSNYWSLTPEQDILQITFSRAFSWMPNGNSQQAIIWIHDTVGNWCINRSLRLNKLSNSGRVMHICVDNLTTIDSDNGLSPGRCQVIIWTNAVILFGGTLETIFSEILFEIHTFSIKKMHLKMSSGKWRPSSLSLNVLTSQRLVLYKWDPNLVIPALADVLACNGACPLADTVQLINSLVPGIFEWNFRHVIFKHIFVIDDWSFSCEIALTWKPQDLTDDQSTLVQVMAWCRQATSHYLNQCWPRSLLPYGVTRPQWVNSLAPGRWDCNLELTIFKLISMKAILKISCETALRWMLQDLTDD